MDPLLSRQLRKHLPAVDANEPQWRAFLAAVESAYVDLRQDRTLIEHTLETASKELTEANEKIRQDESKLAALSRYYQQTLELQQGMIQCVKLTPRGFQFTLSRGQLQHRLGLTSEAVEGRLVEEVVPSADRAAVLNAGFARVWAGEEVATPYTSSNGLELFVLMRPRYENGVICEIIASNIEITALKETERALIAAKERAEAADRAKSEFLAVMSHEIRTPLNAVLGFSDLLLNTPLNAQQKGWMTTVCNSSELLLTLLNDILDFSKIEAGQFELHAEPTILLPMQQEVTALFQERAAQQGVSFALEADADLPANVTLDQRRLRQVLIYLAGNATKFTHAGSIRLCVSATPDVAQPGHERLNFAIVDTASAFPRTAAIGFSNRSVRWTHRRRAITAARDWALPFPTVWSACLAGRSRSRVWKTKVRLLPSVCARNSPTRWCLSRFQCPRRSPGQKAQPRDRRCAFLWPKTIPTIAS